MPAACSTFKSGNVKMEQIRAFIAIELPERLKTALRRLQSQLKTGGHYPVKWVDPPSIHLTLKFLGNISSAQIDDITRTIVKSVAGISPFGLEVSGLGVFPNPRKVQVVWVELGGELDPLRRLQQRLESNLVELGFSPEARGFTPHLTLARVRNHASLQERLDLGQLIAGTRFEDVVAFPVSSLTLMRSQLTPEGAIYRQINVIKLK
ncbi:RNA 2',3'-cyclic phosphodiesterase [Chloroflexota bacterium]